MQPSYLGEWIVPPQSFLRALPDCLDPVQRMRLDALVFSTDALRQCWLSLRELAAAAGELPLEMTGPEKTAFFLHAWAIVDHLNAIRQLLRSLLPNGDPFAMPTQLANALDTAQTMRNGMDHLNQKIPNLAKKKGPQSAIFGAISYFFYLSETSGRIVILTIGMTHGSENWAVMNPAGKPVSAPADLFTLAAFDTQLELGLALALLRDWWGGLLPSLEASITASVAAAAQQQQVPVEQLLQSSGRAGAVATMDWNGIATAT